MSDDVTAGGGEAVRIALASCVAHVDGHGADPELTAALTERGAVVSRLPWDDAAADWAGFDLVVIRSTWDYTTKIDAFRRWVMNVAMTTTLVNPPRLVLDNLHKGYLGDLSDAVPTLVVPAGMSIELDHLGWSAAVVKPAIGAGGDGVVRHAKQADLDALTLDDGVDAVVQPYLDGVERDGEVSVVCVEGEPTHAVRKRPAPGEFLVHAHRGGTEAAEPLTDRLAGLARRALAGLPATPLYARVDVLEHDGRLLVNEVELVEPELFLEFSPVATDRLAAGLVRRARAEAAASSGPGLRRPT